MKKSSAYSLLYQIYQNQPITRRELAVQIDLSMNSISTIVNQLVDSGLVIEDVFQGKFPGRPAGLLSIRPDSGKVVGLDIDGDYSRGVLCDLNANILTSFISSTKVISEPEAILEDLISIIRKVCNQANNEPSNLLGVGIGVRGIVNVRTGVVVDWPNTPAWAKAWTELRLIPIMKDRLGIEPVLVDDTVRAMGVTAYRHGPAKGCENFLYVFLGSGIGSGIFINGWPYLGQSGITGELGHVTIDENGALCSCGNRGCLELVASTPALLRQVKQRLEETRLVSVLREPFERNSLTLDSLLSAARSRDKLAFQVLDEAGDSIGKVLATYINLLDPELVILGGPLAQDGGIIQDAVQRQVRLRALQHIARDFQITSDKPGEFLGAQGAAIMTMDRIFGSTEYLDRLVSRFPG